MNITDEKIIRWHLYKPKKKKQMYLFIAVTSRY